jgi:hypothetical protein
MAMDNEKALVAGDETEGLVISVSDLHVLINSLNHYCFHAGEEKYKQEHNLESLSTDFFSVSAREDVQQFMQCVNWSLKEAQSIIVSRRLALEAASRSDRLAIEPPYTFEWIIHVLTDFADSIGWMMLSHDISWVRSQFLDVHPHSDLEHHNWKSVELVLGHLNADSDQFALATDLTSFMHIGDVFLRNTRTGTAIPYEIKEGRENERIREVFSSSTVEEFEDRLQSHIASATNPEHSFKQIERNLKQWRRMGQAATYTRSKRSSRFDLKSGDPVVVTESMLPEESWASDVQSMITGLRSDDAKLGIIDRCLFFEYGRARHTLLRERFFQYRVSETLGLSLEQADFERLHVIDVGQHTALPGFVPQSTSLLALSEENQARLLALDDYLFVYLHIPAFQQFLADNDVTLTVRNMRSSEHLASDPLMRNILGRNKVAVARHRKNSDNVDYVLAGGLLGRILLNFLAPSTIIELSLVSPVNPNEGNSLH